MTSHIAAALHQVMSKVSYVQKQGENDFHGYKYASEADLLRSLRPAMIEAGLMLIPSIHSVIECDENGNTSIQIEYTLVHKSGEIWPEKIIAAGCGSDKNKNGVGDKGLYKALTGANKYLLFKLFQIETGDDPESSGQQEAALAEAQSNYVKVCLDVIKSMQTKSELGSWWKGEAAARKKLHIINTSDAYKTLSAAAAKRAEAFTEETN